MKLEVSKEYKVTVEKILDKIGVVVRMEDNTTELVHISQIADAFVADPAEFVSVGQELKSTCVEGKVKPAELSFKPLGLKSPYKPRNKFEKNEKR